MYEEEKKLNDDVFLEKLLEGITKSGTKQNFRDANYADNGASGMAIDDNHNQQARDLKKEMEFEAKQKEAQGNSAIQSLSVHTPLLVTVDGLESIQAVNNDKSLTTSEKIDAVVNILAQLAITAGLLVLSRKNSKGGKVENPQNIKQKTKKRPYNPEQHAEFIDVPENLTGGETLKNPIFKAKSKITVENITSEREAFWKNLKEKYFPENEWNNTKFETEGLNYEKFKLKNKKLHDEMSSLYTDIIAAERRLPAIIESGTNTPEKIIVDKNHKFYKLVPEDSNIDSPSVYYIDKVQLEKLKKFPENIEQTLGLPLSSVSKKYYIFEIRSRVDGNVVFSSEIAPTKQFNLKSGKISKDFYKTTGGGTQILIIDNTDILRWQKSSSPVDEIIPNILPKI